MPNVLIKPEEMFAQMADDINRIAEENGVSPHELANCLAEWMGSPVRFKVAQDEEPPCPTA